MSQNEYVNNLADCRGGSMWTGTVSFKAAWPQNLQYAITRRTVIADKDHRKGLDEVLSVLDDTERAVILKRYKDQKTAREIAKELGITKDEVTKRINKAVTKMQSPENALLILHGYKGSGLKQREKHLRRQEQILTSVEKHMESLNRKASLADVRTIGLSERTASVLFYGAEIKTFGELCEACACEDLCSIPGIGPKTADEIIKVLTRFTEQRKLAERAKSILYTA